MRVLICAAAQEAAACAAAYLIARVRSKPASVLGLATGGTMLPVYARMAEACRQGLVSFARARGFSLDEYTGLPPGHPCSYRSYLEARLLSGTDFSPDLLHLPRGDARDAAAEAQRYEALLAAEGPVDLQLLGLGRNGHIGFNEPGSGLDSRTREIRLAASTREANKRFFPAGEAPPETAITVGIRTILESREILLLATGADKAAAAAALVEGPLSPMCPASALQLHRRATVVLDAAAAAGLKRRCADARAAVPGQGGPETGPAAPAADCPGR